MATSTRKSVPMSAVALVLALVLLAGTQRVSASRSLLDSQGGGSGAGDQAGTAARGIGDGFASGARGTGDGFGSGARGIGNGFAAGARGTGDGVAEGAKGIGKGASNAQSNGKGPKH